MLHIDYVINFRGNKTSEVNFYYSLYFLRLLRGKQLYSLEGPITGKLRQASLF
jgi:hypothetical protein